ncbi:MAG: Gfo/Idh/MocA family oxidoreductase [Planctomycetales bacterium]|nr:Gfo/Idh/MocA family oxidoreductase [Planctomycetales bacterium]
MSKLRFGILSTAKIGTEKVIPAMQQGARCQVDAICSRDAERAAAAAQRLGIARSYGSYEELLADPEIDAIYNPLPNHLHVPWSIKALEAGKHVLCEKPIGLSADEGRELVAAAQQHPHLKVMEAFMYRHHPQWQRALQLVQDGSIGRLRTIQSFFSYYNDNASDIRNLSDIGGGGIMDIGCYPISLSRFIFGQLPRRVMAGIELHDKFQTDVLSSAIVEFDGGLSTFTCSTLLSKYQRVNIFGERGRIEIEIPFNAPPDRPCKMWLQRGDEIEEIQFPVCDQYTIQGDLFAAAVLDDTPVPTPLEDAVDNMLVIEALFASAKAGAWQTL